MNTRRLKVWVCILTALAISSHSSSMTLVEAAGTLRHTHQYKLYGEAYKAYTTATPRNLTAVEHRIFDCIIKFIEYQPIRDTEITAKEVLLEDLQEKYSNIILRQETPQPSRARPLLQATATPSILKRLAPSRHKPRTPLTHQSRAQQLQHYQPYGSTLFNDFDELGWEVYDSAKWIQASGSPFPSQPTQRRRTRRIAPRSAAKQTGKRAAGGNTWQQWGAQARALTSQYPKAMEHEDFKLYTIKASPQNGLNCGYHAHSNGHAMALKIVNSLQNRTISLNQLLKTRLPSTRDIELEIEVFRGPTSGQIALSEDELLAFAHFDLDVYRLEDAHGNTIQVFENPDNPGFYWGRLDYLQAARTRDTVTHAIEFLSLLKGRTGDINLFKRIRENSNATATFSHPKITLDEFINLGTYDDLIFNKNTYLDAIKAFRQGKIVMLSWLDHSGTFQGVGHWTCKVFIPQKTNRSYTRPNFVNVINIDSLNSRTISSDTKRFIWDLLHLDLPDQRHSGDIQHILSKTPIAFTRPQWF